MKIGVIAVHVRFLLVVLSLFAFSCTVISNALSPEYWQYKIEKSRWQRSGMKDYSFGESSNGFPGYNMFYTVRNGQCVGSVSDMRMRGAERADTCTHGRYCSCTVTMDSVYAHLKNLMWRKWRPFSAGIWVLRVRAEYDSLHAVKNVHVGYVRMPHVSYDGTPDFSIYGFTVFDSLGREDR